ncbi:hypothetical protein B0H34DRAFT_735346 [Crassisporium funariophilum]|nr:hypothetical protein B0H34DRAFT_735346 [Crassisporium funariophilum]
MNVIRPILYFSVRVLRLFMAQEDIISPHPAIPALGADQRDSRTHNIVDWSRYLLAFHHSPASVKEWKVVTIQWYKNQLKLEHEYVVFTVKRESPEATIYLRFDRNTTLEALTTADLRAIVDAKTEPTLTNDEKAQARKAVKEEKDSLVHNRSRGLLIGSLKWSSRKGLGNLPDDTVNTSWNPTGLDKHDSDRSDLLVTYTDFQHPFYLRDLGVIAQTVVGASDAYLLLVQQCYWLARTLVGISIAKYKPLSAQGQREDAFSRAGRLSNLPFLKSVNSDSPAEIATLLEKVNKAIDDDDKRVEAEYMKGEGAVEAAEEGKKAAEEGKKAAEELLAVERQERQKAEERVEKQRQKERQERAEERRKEREERDELKRQLALFARAAAGDVPAGPIAQV